MKKLTSLLAAGACMAVPAVALADDSGSSTGNPAKACEQLRSAMGDGAFKAFYGTNANRSNAFGKCVSKLARAQKDDQQSASEKCKAEREADGAAFAQKYGTNKNGSNAFGKCVSKKTEEAEDKHKDATVNASKRCKAERKADPDAFTRKYGTNENGSNAFGKCVSRTVKAQKDDDQAQG